MKKLAFLVAAAVVLGIPTAAATAARSSSTAGAGMNEKNIVATAVAAGQFKTLVALVKKAGLVGALSGTGPLTVFAPTDAAFAKLPKATLQALAADKAKLKAVLLYHVAKGAVTAAQVTKLKSVSTLEGASIPVRVSGGKVYIGDAQVVKPNVMASNGVIHVIDKVLVPPS